MADLAEMVTEIIAKTHSGALQWEEPALNELEASLPPYKFLVRPTREGLTLTLFTGDGRPIESVSATTSPQGLLSAAPLPLGRLFEAAKRRARRVDESLAEVEQMLKAL